MPPNVKHVILANMNVKEYSWPLNVSQGCAATDSTDLRGSFSSSFLRRSFLHLTVKKCDNRSTAAEIIIKKCKWPTHGYLQICETITAFHDVRHVTTVEANTNILSHDLVNQSLYIDVNGQGCRNQFDIGTAQIWLLGQNTGGRSR